MVFDGDVGDVGGGGRSSLSGGVRSNVDDRSLRRRSGGVGAMQAPGVRMEHLLGNALLDPGDALCPDQSLEPVASRLNSR